MSYSFDSVVNVEVMSPLTGEQRAGNECPAVKVRTRFLWGLEHASAESIPIARTYIVLSITNEDGMPTSDPPREYRLFVHRHYGDDDQIQKAIQPHIFKVHRYA